MNRSLFRVVVDRSAGPVRAVLRSTAESFFFRVFLFNSFLNLTEKCLAGYSAS